MKPEVAGSLRCPHCVSPIQVNRVVEQSEGEIEYGLLECPECRFLYPVMAGIVLLFGPEDSVDVKAETTARVILAGPKIGDLVEALKAGERLQALSLLLGPMSERGRLFPPLVTRQTAGQRPSAPPDHDWRPRQTPLGSGSRIVRRAQRGLRRALLPTARLRMAKFLITQARNLAALDVIRLYYGSYSAVETFNYFAFRFGQPRHLAALSLASLLHPARGPLLDLACGMGHLTHYLTQDHPGQAVFAVDRDFFRLYVARHYVAPSATFVCAAADQALPFVPGFFGGIFCSDAFHYFLHRAPAIRESLRLLADDGVLILCRCANSELPPHEGYELPLEGYRRLLGKMPHVVMSEDDLIARYRERRGPDMQTESPTELLRSQKWLSVVTSRMLADYRREVRLDDWPHALGYLQINPIYTARRSSEGGYTLAFRFPSKWYAFENDGYQEYAAPVCELSDDDLRALDNQERSTRIDELINRYVVLGMPEAYVHPKRTQADHAAASL